MDLEEGYNKKRAELIVKTKKDIEVAKQHRLENQQKLHKRKQAALQELVKNFEHDFDRISLVSRRLPHKSDYIHYYEHLEY